MESITYTTARANLAKTMDRVCVDHEPVIITRSGETSVVMLSLEDFNSLEETTYLLRSPKNAKRLLEAIIEARAGRRNGTRALRVRLIFSERAWEDYLYWQETDRKILAKINNLIREIQREPFRGIGKPEPLRHAFAGYWSRRINAEHRIVYRVKDDDLLIAQIRYHY